MLSVVIWRDVLFFCFRLIRGEGEVVEEIVSREKQKEINKVRLYDSFNLYIKPCTL